MCILKQPCDDASWAKHVKGHLTSIPNGERDGKSGQFP